MSAQLSQEATATHLHIDFCARLEFRRRVRELDQLAADEGIALPMPAQWIATLEALGYVVDLVTGSWTGANGLQYLPTEAGYNLVEGGAW